MLCIPCLCAAAEPVITIQTTLPWLGSMARFIVGSTINIQQVASWTDAGALKTPRRIPRNIPTIALDPADAAAFGFDIKSDDVRLLYENLPVAGAGRDLIPYDPSILPFLSQRMLIVLSQLSPDNYSFYQRRLAEFQSRLESTLEVGRSLIGDVRILDLTGAISPWIKAATDGAVRPPDDLWRAWSGSTRTPELAMAIDEAKKRDWWVLHDAWTPPPIRSRTASAPKSMTIAPPPADYEFFTHLHDIYLEIWTSSARR
jgi:hypothetical protein